MKCIRSTLRFALPLALLLGTAVVTTTMVSTPAHADEWTYVTDWKADNGNDIVMYKGTDGSILIESWAKDGSLRVSIIGGTVKRYSGEESGTSDAVGKGSRTEPLDVAALIEAGLITYKIKSTPENTPLAKFIDSEGGGMIPHYNPYDDDKSRPGLPKVNNTDGGLTTEQKAEIIKLVNATAKSLEGVGTSMGDGFDALGGESAPGLPTNKNNRGKGTGSGNGTDNNNGKKKYLSSDLSLGPRPDLVNPPHSKTDKSSTLLSVGLLDGSSSFSSNGVSGTGSPVGHGGSHGGVAAIR